MLLAEQPSELKVQGEPLGTGVVESDEVDESGKEGTLFPRRGCLMVTSSGSEKSASKPAEVEEVDLVPQPSAASSRPAVSFPILALMRPLASSFLARKAHRYRQGTQSKKISHGNGVKAVINKQGRVNKHNQCRQ